MESPAGKLVIAHRERSAARALQRLVGVAPCPVEIVSDAAALRAAVDPDAIAIVDLAIAHAAPALTSLPARAWIAVPGDTAEPAAAAAVDDLIAHGWRHVIAHPLPVLAEELLATVQKLRRRDVFGLDKYIAWSAEIESHTLADTRDRDGVLAALADGVARVGLPDRLAALAAAIADELLTGALYFAPIDDRQQRFRAAGAAERDRPRGRALRGRDVVTVRWAIDARTLAIEVRDRWGSLDAAEVTERLVSGRAAAATGERGIGLAAAYACCHQLIIDVEPDVMTELIAVLDIREPAISLGRSASLHGFTVDAPREA